MIAFTDLGLRPQDLHESSTFGGFRPLDILRPFCVSAFIVTLYHQRIFALKTGEQGKLFGWYPYFPVVMASSVNCR
jgi:hypothetical protein